MMDNKFILSIKPFFKPKKVGEIFSSFIYFVMKQKETLDSFTS